MSLSNQPSTCYLAFCLVTQEREPHRPDSSPFPLCTGHQGRARMHTEIRSSGFWIMDSSSIVGHHISKCVTCRKLRAAPQQQKMADLPSDRLEQVIYLQCSGLLWTILHQRRAKGNEAIWSALYLHGFPCHPPGNGIFIDDRLILECISSICLSLQSCSAGKVEPGYQFCRRKE